MQKSTPTTHKRRPQGRLFLLALLLLFTPATAQNIPLLELPNPTELATCITHENPRACLDSHMPTHETPDTSDEDQGFVDMVEAVTPSSFTGAFDLPGFIDGAASMPYVHFGHESAYYHCLESGNLDACSETYLISRPALPEHLGAEASAAIEKAWQKFNTNVIEDIHHALNTGERCYSPVPQCWTAIFGIPPKPALPRPDCILRKVATELPQALLRHYPTYLAEAFEAVATHLPNSLIYGFNNDSGNPIANPLTGSLLAPLYAPDAILDFDPSTLPISLDALKTTDLTTLSPELRAQIYYHQTYLAQMGIYLNTPVLPHETTGNGPGVAAFERDKQDFTAGSALDQEYKGYTFLYQLQAPTRSHVFYDTSFSLFTPQKPSVDVKCASGVSIPLYFFPVPVPSTLPIFEDRTIAIGEGHFIPDTTGKLVPFP